MRRHHLRRVGFGIKVGVLGLLAVAAVASMAAAAAGRLWRADVWHRAWPAEVPPHPQFGPMAVRDSLTIVNAGGGVAIRKGRMALPGDGGGVRITTTLSDGTLVNLDEFSNRPASTHYIDAPNDALPRVWGGPPMSRLGLPWLGAEWLADGSAWSVVVPWPAVTLACGLPPAIALFLAWRRRRRERQVGFPVEVA